MSRDGKPKKTRKRSPRQMQPKIGTSHRGLLRRTARISSEKEGERYWLAVSYDRKGLTRKAVKYYLLSFGIRPSEFDLTLTLGDIHLDRGGVNAALKEYRRAVKIDVNSVEAKRALAFALIIAGNPQKALEANPWDEETLSNAAAVYINAGKPLKAAQHLREALRINLLYAPAHYNLGVLHMREGEDAKAAEEFRKAAGHTNIPVHKPQPIIGLDYFPEDMGEKAKTPNAAPSEDMGTRR